MRVARFSAPAVLAGLLILTGCASVIVRVDNTGSATAPQLEGHTRIAKGTVVVWRASDAFFVAFDTTLSYNPCSDAPSGYSNVYVAKQITKSGKTIYEASCKITRPVPGSPATYGLIPGGPPAMAKGAPSTYSVTSCKGCLFEPDPSQ
jgi:hypothetical protein